MPEQRPLSTRDLLSSELDGSVCDTVYEVLVILGAHESDVASFRAWWPGDGTEYRFCGLLGFGGKFRRNRTRNEWYVDYYREDDTPERRAIMWLANRHLEALRIRLGATV